MEAKEKKMKMRFDVLLACVLASSVAYGQLAVDGVVYMDAGSSLADLNGLDLRPGTKVLFQCGGVWRGTVRARPGVTYAAYGSGDKPRLFGSPEDGADPAK